MPGTPSHAGGLTSAENATESAPDVTRWLALEQPIEITVHLEADGFARGLGVVERVRRFGPNGTSHLLCGGRLVSYVDVCTVFRPLIEFAFVGPLEPGAALAFADLLGELCGRDGRAVIATDLAPEAARAFSVALARHLARRGDRAWFACPVRESSQGSIVRDVDGSAITELPFPVSGETETWALARRGRAR